MLKPTLITITLLVLSMACGLESQETPDTAAVRGAERLAADVAFLASDSLEGRGTPSRGLDLAALYLETQLRAAGVEPAVGNSYRQQYKIGQYRPGTALVSVRIDGKTVPPEDYIFINIGYDPANGPIEGDLVGAGDGIVAEERNVDDLKGLDLRGKAVVARKGAPWKLEPSAVFGPDRAIGKVMAATVRGGSMLVYLSSDLDRGDEAEAGFFREMKNAPVAFVREPGLGQASALNPILVLEPRHLTGASEGGSAAALRGALNRKIAVTIESQIEEGVASNVLGRISGTDASLATEHVVLSAHYDHLGSHTVPEGVDGIWNGADDNASGSAGILEVSRRIAAAPGKRSLLVFFTSGEDRGIFGSAYYAGNPVVPMASVTAQINLDMIGRSEGSVQGIGPYAPSLEKKAAEIASRHGIEVIPDQQPTWRIIYLTDLYHFAKSEVPGIEFFTGTHPDYHQPSDTADKIRYAEMSKIVSMATELTRFYLDGAPRPAFVRPEWFVTP